MKLSLAIVALVVALVALPMFLSPPKELGDGKPVEGLPWQINVLADGKSRVFGLTVGSSTISDARLRFGTEGDIAIVAAPGEAGSLEAYYSDVTAGAITGKLIVTGQLDKDTLDAMRQRTKKAKYMNSATKKAMLADEDLPVAYAAPIRALAFIPSANLDEGMILQRFGQPGERIRTSEHTEHFLYPDRGLDIILDSEGKELLQYVAPRDFAKLREPLLKSQGEKK
jgi:hypothetical protein